MAGLLDFLGSGGPSGGLLDGIPAWLQQQFGAGQQPPQPRQPWGMDQYDGARQPQPPAPQQMAPGGGLPRTPLGEAPKYSPGIGNRLYGAFTGGVNGTISNGLFQGLVNAGKSLATGEVTDPLQLQDRQLLERYSALQRDFGLTEPQARAFVQDPKMAEALMPLIAPKHEFKEAGQYYGGFNPATGKYSIQGVAPKAEKLDPGQNLVYGAPGLPGQAPAPKPGVQGGIFGGMNGQPLGWKDAASTTASGTTAASGNPGKPLEYDMGTHTILLDPVTRKEIGRIPKNIQEKKTAEVEGELRGTANVNLPDTITNATQALGLIDKIEKHPGKAGGTGFWGAFPTLPGTRVKDFDIAVDQLKSQAFLQAYTQLRGSGAISDKEGQVATAAQARLNQAGSEGEFNVALKELKDVLKNGIDRARLKASGTHRLSTSPPPGYVVQ